MDIPHSPRHARRMLGVRFERSAPEGVRLRPWVGPECVERAAERLSPRAGRSEDMGRAPCPQKGNANALL